MDTDPEISDGSRLRVMSFNIRRGDADAGSPHAWQHRRSLVVELLRDSCAAVIGLQEVGLATLLEVGLRIADCSKQVLPFQLEQLASDLPEMGWVGEPRAVTDGAEVTYILFFGHYSQQSVQFMSLVIMRLYHVQEERCAILFEQSVLKLLFTETRWLSDAPLVVGSRSWGAACARVVTELRPLQWPAAGPATWGWKHYE
jgi:hypothetical protein